MSSRSWFQKIRLARSSLALVLALGCGEKADTGNDSMAACAGEDYAIVFCP